MTYPDRTLAIIQARMGSTRLPGKVLAEIEGKLMLDRVVQRVSSATRVDEVVVATSEAERDDAIAERCETRGWLVVRGSEEDVLSRYVHAANEHQANVIVRITADCPLIDPEVIDTVVIALCDGSPAVDYASNTIEPRTFPRGLDVEAFTIQALERADRLDHDPASREHVTPLMRRDASFNTVAVHHPIDLSDHRWTVDTEADLAFVREVTSRLGDEFAGLEAILSVLRRDASLTRINADIEQKRTP